MSEINLCYIYDTIEEKYYKEFIDNFPKIINHIATYINKSSAVLQTRNVGLHLNYTASIENDFFECCGVDRNDIINILNESPNLSKEYNDQMNPLYNFALILSCFYEKHEKEMIKLYGNKVSAYKIVRLYLTLKIYSMAQRYIFKHEPKEEIMEYVLEHLSNRFEIVKTKNIYTMLVRYTETNNNSLEIDFTKIEDNEIYPYVSQMITRLRKMLKNIYREFDKAYRDRKKIITEDLEATNREEDKKFDIIASNVSNTIEIFSKKILQSFIQDIDVKNNLIVIACKRTGNGRCSVEKSKQIIKSIKQSKDNSLLLGIIKDIVSYWIISLHRETRTTHSIDFIKRCSAAYSISNTYDIFIIDLKEKLTEIISKYGNEYIDTEKRSTLNVFKQVVFLYLVFYISSLE